MKSPAAKKIAELDKQIDDVMKKNNELRHLRTLANRAIGTAEHMKTVLTQVKKLNTKDTSNKKRYKDFFDICIF